MRAILLLGVIAAVSLLVRNEGKHKGVWVCELNHHCLEARKVTYIKPHHVKLISVACRSPRFQIQPAKMRIAAYSVIALVMVGVLVVPAAAKAPGWWEFIEEVFEGMGDMWRSYSDMREANTIGADKYFHARGNYEASQRGPGGRWAAEVISDAREGWQGLTGRGAEDTEADQEANNWGRNGGDPNHYRPDSLKKKY